MPIGTLRYMYIKMLVHQSVGMLYIRMLVHQYNNTPILQCINASVN